MCEQDGLRKPNPDCLYCDQPYPFVGGAKLDYGEFCSQAAPIFGKDIFNREGIYPITITIEAR